MKIGVIGWWHHDNQGDLAMLNALTCALEAHQVVPIDVGFAINAEAMRRLNQLDFLMLGGGTLFDATPPYPFDTFDVWEQDLQTPLGAIGIGVDMVAPKYRAVVKRLLDRSEFFYVRDRHSQQVLDHPRVRVASDITFFSPIESSNRPHDGVERQTVCGVNLRHSPGLPVERWIEAIKSLPCELRGVPLSTYGSWQELQILQRIDTDCAPEFRSSSYDGLDLMVGTAFHSIVFAAQAAVPVIAIAYAPKVRQFMREIGLEDYVLEPHEWQKLGPLADRVLREQNQLTRQLRQTTVELTHSIQQAIADVAATIDRVAARPTGPAPRVSLIVIGDTHSEANRLTLESCFGQVYPDIEVLFVGNDPHVSSQVSPAWAALKIIHATAGSPAEWLNLAIPQTSGDYIAWITAGDFYTRDAISCMVDSLQRDRTCDMVYTDYYTVRDRDCIADAHFVPDSRKLLRQNVVGLGFLFRRQLSDDLGPLRTDTPLADYDYWLRAAASHRLKTVHVLLFYARVSHQATYTRLAERTTRRRWYATHPRLLLRAAGFLFDTDFVEGLIMRPLRALHRGFARLRSALAQRMKYARNTRNTHSDPESARQ